MKIITIGDIHGRDIWKPYLFQPLNDSLETRFDQADKVIFIGDYVDSFDRLNFDIYDNLVEIIELKKQYPDKVILLLGNHDYSYVNGYTGISGYRISMEFDLKQLFNKEWSLFDAAFQYGDVMWTHAGLSEKYLDDLRKFLKQRNLYDDIVEQGLDTAEVLNVLKEMKSDELYLYSVESGGTLPRGSAGPLWIRPRELELFAPDFITQVVGHTVMNQIDIRNIGNDNKIFFVDTVKDFSGEFLILEFSDAEDLNDVKLIEHKIEIFSK